MNLSFVSTIAFSIPPDKAWMVFVGAGLLVIAIVVPILYYDRQRTKELTLAANALGLTFRHQATSADKTLILGCQLAKRGYNNRVRNIVEVSKTPDLDFTLFDFEYMVNDGGRSATTYRQTVSRIRSPLLKLPLFALVPGRISWLAKLFGAHDIDFPDSPKFSRTYILRANDEAAVRAFFTPALRQLIESLDELTIEGGDDGFFLFRFGWRIDPDLLATTIEQDKRVLAAFIEAQRSVGIV